MNYCIAVDLFGVVNLDSFISDYTLTDQRVVGPKYRICLWGNASLAE